MVRHQVAELCAGGAAQHVEQIRRDNRSFTRSIVWAFEIAVKNVIATASQALRRQLRKTSTRRHGYVA
jgi:hypothetical protein